MSDILYDRDIRDPLFDFLEATYGKVRILEEKITGSARADAVMVLESLVAGIEIKSDADTYARLSRQIKDYDVYFDKNILAVGSTHAMHAREHIPEYWGVVSVEDTGSGLDFYDIREPAPSPKVKIRKQLDLLWRRELTGIQQQNRLHKYAGKRRSFVERYVVESVDEKSLKQQIRDILFDRDYSVFDAEKNN